MTLSKNKLKIKEFIQEEERKKDTYKTDYYKIKASIDTTYNAITERGKILKEKFGKDGKDYQISLTDLSGETSDKTFEGWLLGETENSNSVLPGRTGYPVLGYLKNFMDNKIAPIKSSDSSGGSLSRKTKLKLRFNRQKNKKSKRKLKKYIFKRKTYKNNKRNKTTTKRKKKLYI